MTETITGTCPVCQETTSFRELTFTENVSEIFSFVGGAIAGGLNGKVSAVTALIDSHNDDREFPNYNCLSCGKLVMQCNNCDEIIPYADSGAAHVCYSSNSAASPIIKKQAEESSAQDAVSLLEQLAILYKNLFTICFSPLIIDR